MFPLCYFSNGMHLDLSGLPFALLSNYAADFVVVKCLNYSSSQETDSLRANNAEGF